MRFPKTHFVVVLPVPTFDKLYPNWICNLNSFRPSLPSHCFSKLPLDFHLSSISLLKDSLFDLSSETSNIHVFDPTSLFCNAERLICSSSQSGVSLYSDDSHLSQKGSYILNTALASFLKTISH